MAGQYWSTSSLGGYLYNDQLSDKFRMANEKAVRFPWLCDAMDYSDKKKHTGTLVHWDVATDLPLGTNDGLLTEGTAIGSVNFTIAQGTATIKEYGISVPFTNLLEDWAALDIQDCIRRQLARHAKYSHDYAAFREFNKCALRYVGTSTAGGVLTTNGTATATNTSALNKFHVRRIVTTMKERDIPGFIDDDYVAVGRPTAFEGLLADLESVYQHTPSGFERIIPGEIGRYNGVRFVEQTSIPIGTSTYGGIPSGTAWSKDDSDNVFFLGQDTVGYPMVCAPEIRGQVPTDFGRSKALAWYGQYGFGIANNSTTDPTAARARIVKWDSAA